MCHPDNAITVADWTFPVLVHSDGERYVPIAKLCESLGLDESGQRARLKKAGWATQGKISSVGSSGKRRTFSCLHIGESPMFFATLDGGHLDEPRRAALVRFQSVARKALQDYFAQGFAIHPEVEPEQVSALARWAEEFFAKIAATDPAWPAQLTKRYASWHGRAWREGDAQPKSMRSFNGFFYTMIFPKDVIVMIRARSLEEACRYHQTMTNGPRDYLKRQLELVTALAEGCRSERECRARMRIAYKKTRPHMSGTLDLGL